MDKKLFTEKVHALVREMGFESFMLVMGSNINADVVCYLSDEDIASDVIRDQFDNTVTRIRSFSRVKHESLIPVTQKKQSNGSNG